MTRLLLLLLLAAAAVHAQLWHTPFLLPGDKVKVDTISGGGVTAAYAYLPEELGLECVLYLYDRNATARVAEKIGELVGGSAIVYAGVEPYYYGGGPPVSCRLYRHLQAVWPYGSPPEDPTPFYMPATGVLIGAASVGTSPDVSTTQGSYINICNDAVYGFIVQKGQLYVVPGDTMYLVEASTCNVYMLGASSVANVTGGVFPLVHVPPELGRLWAPLYFLFSEKYFYAGELTGVVRGDPFACPYETYAPPEGNVTHLCIWPGRPDGVHEYSAAVWAPLYYNSSWGSGVMPAVLAWPSANLVIDLQPDGYSVVTPNPLPYPSYLAPYLVRLDADNYTALAVLPNNQTFYVHGRVHQIYAVSMVNYEGKLRIGKHAVCFNASGGAPQGPYMYVVEAVTTPAVAKIRNDSPSTIYVMTLTDFGAAVWVEEIPPGEEAYVVTTGTWYIGVGDTPCNYAYYDYSTSYAGMYAVWDGTQLAAVGELMGPDYEAIAQWYKAVNDTLSEVIKRLKELEEWYKSLYRRGNATVIMSILTSKPPGPIPFYATHISTFSYTTIKTHAEVLTKYTSVAPPPLFFGPEGGAPLTAVAPPAAGLAAAAAGALGVAWAASRRDDDVVTAAAVAGTALALFSLLFTMVYGAEGLSLAALGIIIAAAAAAYKLAVTRS